MKLNRMIKTAAAMLCALMLTPGIGSAEMNRYQTVFMDLFDTVTSVVGYAPDEAAFQKETQKFHDGMLHYHQLYDIYHTYEGIVNLCTLNAHAGEIMEVSPEIMDLLLFAREVSAFSGGRTAATLGSVLTLWHEAREAGIEHPETARLPEEEALLAARGHTGFELLQLDEEKGTVLYLDSELRLDVGALAKGYATQKVGETMESGYLISVGGNVYATGPKPDGSAWTIGVQDPDGNGDSYLDKLSIKSGSVVTSGDYQRYYTVEGKNYHHIIDPETLYPATRWRSVTVVTPDSGLADALSTTLFLMSREEGEELLARFGAEAAWMGADGTLQYSPGYEQYRKK